MAKNADNILMNKIATLSLCTISLLALIACKNKKIDSDSAQNIPETSVTDHAWYYFTSDGFATANLPQSSAIQALKPWTESLRVNAANSDGNGRGWLLVNRLGMISFDEDGKPLLFQDYRLFSNSTAENLFFSDGMPFFTLYKSSFFNEDSAVDIKSSSSSNKGDANRPYLVRLNTESKTFFPAVTYGDLNLTDGGEITGSFYDGMNFYSCVKSTEDTRIVFDYIKWKTPAALTSLSPVTQSGKVKLSGSNESEYRNVKSPKNFSKAPERLQELLANIPADFNFIVTCSTAGGFSPNSFLSGSGESSLKAEAIVAPGWICALFSDGTTYFSGALDGKFILNKGEPVAFRLPKLPDGFSYNYFCISGGKMAAAWEESDFYKTGRSGFLIVDLANILYSELPTMEKSAQK